MTTRSSSLLNCGRRAAAAIFEDKISIFTRHAILEALQPISLRTFSPALASFPGTTPHPLCFSSTTPIPTERTSAPSSTIPWEKHVLYRGRGIQLFRILVRFKIFQLTGIAALAIPITTFLSSGEVSSLQTVIATSLVIGSGAASTALWYYSRRYLGELSILEPISPTSQPTDASTEPPPASSSTSSYLPQDPKVRFSVLDFWGNREDVDIALEDVVPPLAGLLPAAAAAAAAEPFLPITASGDRQYIISLRFGHVLDGATLKSLLSGSLISPSSAKN